jgi:hypothetical protein
VGDFEKGFKSAATAGTQAVLIQDDPLSFVERKEIARLGLKHRLPGARATRAPGPLQRSVRRPVALVPWTI